MQEVEKKGKKQRVVHIKNQQQCSKQKVADIEKQEKPRFSDNRKK